MNHLTTFANNTILEEQLWSVFGMSVKQSESSIGRFGTGLKYAIATLLRNNRYIQITTNGKVYDFSTKSTTVRDKEFSQIICNGKELPYTTELGKEWKLWQAYREIYSNCLDEGGRILDPDMTNPFGEYSTVVLADFSGVDHNEVCVESRELIHSGKLCDIYKGQSTSVFYRGMKAMELRTPSLFTYSMKNCTITEDRTIAYRHEIDNAIMVELMSFNNKEFSLRFMMGTKGFMEETINYGGDNTVCDSVKDIFEKYRRDNVYIQPYVKKCCASYLGSAIYDKKEPTERQSRIIDKAKEFCAKIGFPILYPVFCCVNLGNSTLAIADRKTNQIYLSDRVLDQGLKQVVATLIEENVHLKEGLNDECYEMQTFLFDKIVTMGEMLTGDIL